MLVNNASPIVVRCVFSGNVARRGGALASVFFSDEPIVVNCAFFNTVTGSSPRGGAVYAGGSCCNVVRYPLNKDDWLS